jgi:hypothetical protein
MLNVTIKNKLRTISFGLFEFVNLPNDTNTDASLKLELTYGKSYGVISVYLKFPFYPISSNLWKLF